MPSPATLETLFCARDFVYLDLRAAAHAGAPPQQRSLLLRGGHGVEAALCSLCSALLQKREGAPGGAGRRADGRSPLGAGPRRGAARRQGRPLRARKGASVHAGWRRARAGWLAGSDGPRSAHSGRVDGGRWRAAVLAWRAARGWGLRRKVRLERDWQAGLAARGPAAYGPGPRRAATPPRRYAATPATPRAPRSPLPCRGPRHTP